MNKLCFSIKRLILLVTITFFPAASVLATSKQKNLFQYFTDNVFVHILISGGYYSLGIIAITIITALIFEKFRTIILSFLLAIFGLLLVIFVFEALDNLEWIPPL